MNEENMSNALDAIHDEAMKLLEHGVPDQASRGLELIISIARYKCDVRSEQERGTEH
ncbi:MAG: hypothetical protein Q8J63_01015 [Candidatus Aquicultor sp.]|nr:hypothetical protein [Candidatus Aquicultor sp.]